MRRKKGKNHGFSNTRLYTTWCGMKARCNNPKEKAYKYYGGKGIKIATEWENDFLQFRQWALQNGYNENLTIERIDVNGNYCPENCTFITMYEQAQNKRRNHIFYVNGKAMSARSYCQFKGINYNMFMYRLGKGWKISKILDALEK